MKPSIRAIFFDIGGTLVQKLNHGSRDALIIAEMAQFLQAKCSPEELIKTITARENEYKVWRSRSMTELSYAERWTRFLLPDYPEALIRQNADRLQAWWSESRGKRWIAPETVQTMRELAGRGYILGSISHTSPKYLDDAGIRDLFQTTVLAAEFGKRKPHPAPFLAAARECGIAPQACAYVGDRPSRDVVGSREAGFGQVILLQRDNQADEGVPCPMQADIVIHSLPELLGYFPEVNWVMPRKGDQAQVAVLYDAALSTMWWSKETDSANDFCEKARRLGFARIELNHQISPEDFAAFDLNRYHIGSLHDPCPAVIPNKQLEREDCQITSLDPQLRQCGVDTVKRTIEQAYQLGAREVVIHPGRIPGDHSLDEQLRELYRQGLKGTPAYQSLSNELVADRKSRSQPHLDALLLSLSQIVDFAAETGISLGLENRYHYYELPIFDEMEILLNTFQQPWVGWQLDVGHLQTYDALGLMSFRQWLERFSQRIIGVHLHDIQGISDHRIPGSGNMDYHWLAAYLPADSVRTVEISKSIPFHEVQRGLIVLEESGCITRI